MAIDGQPAGEDAIGPGADIGLCFVVINTLLKAVTHWLQILEVVRRELRYNCLLIEATFLIEEAHLLHEALHIAGGATMLWELIILVLLVNVFGHIKLLLAFLMRLHRILVRAYLKLGADLKGSYEYEGSVDLAKGKSSYLANGNCCQHNCNADQ